MSDEKAARAGGRSAAPTPLRRFPPLIERGLRRAILRPRLPGLTPGLAWQLAGGKRLRPAIVLWLIEALAGKVAGALPVALAVECLHNFLLARDDIEDGDTMRRNRPTLWARFGIPIALNVADYLLARTYEQVAAAAARDLPLRAELAELLTTALRITLEGQGRDLEGRGDGAFTLRRYEELVRRKTGRYLAFGWVGGARLAGVPRREAERFWFIGEHLGAAFQMRDDLLDLGAAKGRGEEVGCDIREGKPSALFALALASRELKARDRARLLRIMRRERAATTEREVAWVTRLYREIGAIEECRRCAARHAARALDGFDSLRFLPQSARAEFHEIAAFMVEREV